MKLLHKTILGSHLLAGVIGGVVIFIMSLTGFVLTYEDRLVEFVERELGDATYDHFCKCGRDFDALERHGARRIYQRVDCDVDYDAPAKHWLDGVLARLVEDERSGLSA